VSYKLSVNEIISPNPDLFIYLITNHMIVAHAIETFGGNEANKID
jgi:hypothetical protein